jgi:hypothetical protein
LAIVVAVGAYYGYNLCANARAEVVAHITTWFEGPRLMTELMMERYGPPDDLTPGVATWYERGRWKRITVRGQARESYLEQTVGYRPRTEAIAPLNEFDHGVRLDPAREELTAASNQESLNYLALNVADEVATGRRSSKDAQEFFAKTAKLATSGRSSEYLEKLLFEPYVRTPQRSRAIGL